MNYDESWVKPPKPNAPPRKIHSSRNDTGQLIRNDDPMMDEANAPLPTYTHDPEDVLG